MGSGLGRRHPPTRAPQRLPRRAEGGGLAGLGVKQRCREMEEIRKLQAERRAAGGRVALGPEASGFDDDLFGQDQSMYSLEAGLDEEAERKES